MATFLILVSRVWLIWVVRCCIFWVVVGRLLVLVWLVFRVLLMMFIILRLFSIGSRIVPFLWYSSPRNLNLVVVWYWGCWW